MEFVDILQEYRIPFETEGRYSREGWIQFQCPYCFGGTDPDKPYMGYNIAYRYVNCWRCGNHRLADTIARLTNMPIREAIKLAGSFERLRTDKLKPTGTLKLPKGVNQMTLAHKNYLKERRYNPKELEKLWHLQGIGPGGKLSWRLFIPISLNGQTVSWTTRAIGNHKLRYVSAGLEEESVPHKSILYGEEFVRHAIIVCEGPADVWRIGPGAVCTFGSEITPSQLERIARYPIRYLCFDNEPQAQRMARRYVDELSAFDGKSANIVLDAPDPGEASRREILKVRSLLD